MKKLIDLDKWLFIKINREWANPFFDQLMPFLRVPGLWIPFYLFLFVFVIINFKKKAFPWILLLAATASLTDLISSRIIKPGFGRLRPCNNVDMSANIRMLADYCGGNGSFTSSHAANHFGMAIFLFITLKTFCVNWRWLFILWAAAVCYAQVYVGVHFPLDVAGGALLGCIIGGFSATIFMKKFGPFKINI